MRKFLSTVFALSLPLLGGCGTLSKITLSAESSQVRCPLNLESETAHLVNPLLADKSISGISIGIRLPDGSKSFYGYGRISEGNANAPDKDTVAAVGSITKGFVAAITDDLVAAGQLQWNDTLSPPPRIQMSESASRITLRELATHTSGLPRQPSTFSFFRLFLGYLFSGRDFYRNLDEKQAYAYLSHWKNPGKATNVERYSNLGYALLARELELRTGRSLDALLAEKITIPLGMTRTGFHPEQLASQRMSGHAGDQPKFIRRGKVLEDWNMNSFMRGTGGVYSSANDLLIYADYALSHPSSAHALIAWHKDPLAEPGVYYQTGVNSGHTTFVGIDTRKNIAVVVLQDTFNWTDKVGRDLMRRISVADATCQTPSGALAPSAGKSAAY